MPYTSRDMALIAAFAAVYTVWGFVSSIAFRSLTLSIDLFFLIAALFTILAVVVQKPWSATILGIIEGIIFLGTPAPNVWHITVSLIANGFVFDLYLNTTGPRHMATSRFHIVVAATLGNLIMGLVGLSTFLGPGASFPLLYWSLLVTATVLAGAVGAGFGLLVARRIQISRLIVERVRPAN